jgi:hypothetical protein
VNDPLCQLAARIRREMKDVERVLRRMEEGWKRAQRSSDDYYLDGVALNLHGFYGGLERLFERIAALVDDARPTGQNWHQMLLQQMTEEIPGVRPAVISESVRVKLDEYRSFRHVARNIYTFNLDPAKLEHLVVQATTCFPQARAELLAFADLLEREGGGDEE